MAETVPLTRPGQPEAEVVLLTVTAAARRMGISRSSAYRLVEDGDLPVVDVARKGTKRPKLRVDVREIARFVDSRRLEAVAS